MSKYYLPRNQRSASSQTSHAVAAKLIPGQRFRGERAAAEASRDTAPRGNHGLVMNARTVLVVEDSEDTALLIRFVLERERFRVELAVDGQQAERMIATLPPPALVILDILLPYVDGFQLLQQIRGLDSWKQVPVIMLTAKSQEKDIVRALDAGANAYIVKPFQPDELLARTRRLTKGAHR